MTEREIERHVRGLGFAANWTSNLDRAVEGLALAEHAGVSVVHHLGNIATRYERSIVDSIDRECRRRGLKLWVTPGNEEGWGHSELYPRALGRPELLGAAVGVLPRGYRWTQRDYEFVSLGGGVTSEDETSAIAASGEADIVLSAGILGPVEGLVSSLNPELHIHGGRPREFDRNRGLRREIGMTATCLDMLLLDLGPAELDIEWAEASLVRSR